MWMTIAEFSVEGQQASERSDNLLGIIPNAGGHYSTAIRNAPTTSTELAPVASPWPVTVPAIVNAPTTSPPGAGSNAETVIEQVSDSIAKRLP